MFREINWICLPPSSYLLQYLLYRQYETIEIDIHLNVSPIKKYGTRKFSFPLSILYIKVVISFSHACIKIWWALCTKYRKLSNRRGIPLKITISPPKDLRLTCVLVTFKRKSIITFSRFNVHRIGNNVLNLHTFGYFSSEHY